jgi:hypothetical protein
MKSSDEDTFNQHVRDFETQYLLTYLNEIGYIKST